MRLNMSEQQDFRICQLTDIHLGGFPLNEASLKTLNEIKNILDNQRFDLLIVTGDLIWSKDVDHSEESLKELYSLFNQSDIPVAITYGNHDSEGNFNRSYVRSLENELKNPADKHNSFIFEDRECYTLEIFCNESLTNVLYFWDSGAYSKWPKFEQYATIEPEQVEWFNHLPYKRTSENVDLGFLHIPFPEYKLAAQNILQGSKNEEVCSPVTNSGLFYSLQRKKNVKGIFAGHDHDNNFVADYRGVKLIYGNITGYNTYGQLPRGVRVIDLHPQSFETEILTF
ncbi:metallophosphoesterase family protein [Liquorilactobacillus sicerae]|uniref:metallophosphoesterase family protein n=1 Tax=Liquorilactobacillus sicerae TaxID=1416943 RepID=UPI002480E270|nr:metallophosphoesterase family protein [Liquorilactobacillus sicerae]